MSDDKKSNKLELQDLLDKFKEAEDFWRDTYLRGSDDAEFVLADGGQWPPEIRKQRERDGRICLTDNRLLNFVNQVVNQIRQTRPTIIPKPVKDGADVETAEIIRGVVRNIEAVSDADTVYDTAARNSVMSGLGWIRVGTKYSDYDSFDQEAYLERVQNFRSVYLDPSHQRQDGSDAEHGFAFTDMAKDIFERDYPDASLDGWELKGDVWMNENTVRVCEYFYKKREEVTLTEYEVDTIAGKIKGVTLEPDLPSGVTVLRTRKTHICKIGYAKFTGGEILEGEEGDKEFPGQYIPLVPIYGFEAFIQDKRTAFSLIHPAKDPQRMLNYWKSTTAEIVALQPKAPYVGAVGQFNTYSVQWADANRQNLPFLEYDPVTIMGDNGETMLLPPPMRQPPVSSSGSLLQEAQACVDSIKASMGMYDASLGNQTKNVESGKALISRQMQGDNATFHFVDNMAVGIRHVGRILIGIIPLVYSGERIIRILGEDGKETMVPLGKPVVKQGKSYVDPQQGQQGKVIRLDAGKYDVVVEVGPSYATRRMELANLLSQIIIANPDMWKIAGDLFIKSLDIPGAEQIAKRIQATMDPALLGDDVEAARLKQLTEALNEIQNKLQLTEEALLAKKNNQEFENSLEAKKVDNDTKKLMIEAAKAEAEIEKIKFEIGGSAPEDVLVLSSAISQLKAQTDDVSNALHVLLSTKEAEAKDAPIEASTEATGEPVASPAIESMTDA